MFDRRLHHLGITQIRIPFRSPRASAISERWSIQPEPSVLTSCLSSASAICGMCWQSVSAISTAGGHTDRLVNACLARRRPLYPWQHHCDAGVRWAPSHLQSGCMISRMEISRPNRLLKNGLGAQWRATLIQERGPSRKIDSMSGLPRFDCCSSLYPFRVFQQPAKAALY